MGVEAALSKKDPSTTLTSQPQSVVRQVKCESKEMQTDIVTKADKGVDSWTPPRIDPALVLKRDMATGEKGRLRRTRQASDQRSVSEDTPPGEELDKDFLEKVKSTQVSTSCSYATQRFAQVEKSDAAVPRIKDESSKLNTNKDRGVPPPSPTAMERLMQEMDEEDSDEEEQERKEIEQAMRRETEMKEFTHKIYKRLSDLLYSHSGDEEEEDDCKEEDDEDGKTNVATGGVIVKEDDEVFEGCANPSPRAKHTRDHPLELERPESLLTTDEDKVRSPSYNTGDSLRTTDYDSLENKSILARGIVVNASGRVGSPLEFSDDEPYPKPDYRPIVTSRVLTIESSSSLTTTTESESEVEETPVIIFKPPPAEQTTELRRLRDYREDPELPTLLRNAIISRNMGGAGLWEDEDRNKSRSPVAEEVFERKAAPTVFVFPERSVDFEQEQQTKSFDDARELDKAESAIPRGDFRKQQQPQLSYQQRRSSREYHSDDDVVAGRGVPEYYDDSTLWVSRRQQRPPVQFSQLSLAVVAQRRRERRERWLKKRRRNRTDLVSSTGGSSDTDRDHRSEVTGQQQGGPRQASQHQAPHAGAVVRRIPAHDRRHFLSGSSLDAYEDYPEDKEQGDGRNPHDMGSGILASPKYAKPIVLSFLGGNIPTATARDSEVTATDTNQDKRFAGYTRESEAKALGSSEIPGIEETFNELKSVQNILEGLQDRKGASGAKSASETVSKGKPPIPNPSLLSPLTSENLRSLRSYDKSGSSRRSRMSLTDRTESDLDLYSERGCDDENSSGSEYADDEGEGDNGEDEETCYNTAEDDLDTGTGASRRPASGLTISDTSASRRSGNLSDESESTDFVVSCTFYNSNVSPPDLANTTTGTSAASAHSAAAPPFSGHAGSGTTSTSVSSSDPLMAVSATSSVTSHTPVAGPPAPHVFSHGQGHNSGLHSGGAASSNSRHIYYLQGPQVQQQTADVAGFALPGFASPSAPRYPQRSTFQSARNQMQDIQTHLQALRRQMEVLPDDDDSGDVTDRTMSSSYPGPDISTE